MAILRRLGERPGASLIWYLYEKPRLFWGWSIRIGVGDIYVFPVVNSPFDTQPVLRALAALCKALNPIITVLMAIGIALVGWQAGRQPEAWKSPDVLAAVGIGLLLLYVTLIYGILQAELHYSTPFRAFELLMAVPAFRVIVVWIDGKRQGGMSDAQAASP